MVDTTLVKAQTDLIDLIGRSTRLHKIAAKEWAGPCPTCGGKDRLHVHLDYGWFCSHCTGRPDAAGHWMDAIDFVMMANNVNFLQAYQILGGDAQVDPEQLAQIKAERERREAEQAQADAAAQRAAREKLNASGAAQGYWQALTPDRRALWHDRGLSDLWIDYFQVGVCERRTFWHDGKSFDSPTLTIPTWQPTLHYDSEPSVTWSCIGLVHRLLIPNPPGGKYRPHMTGTGKPLFKCDIYDPHIQGDVLLVEGEIKAMVTWAHLQDWVYRSATKNALGRLSVVGIAGKSFKQEWVAEFERAERIYICMDPDTNIRPVNAGPGWKPAADRIAGLLGAERCRIIDLPGKIDDMIVGGSLNVFLDLPGLIRTAKGAR